VGSLAWSPGGDCLASGDNAGTVRIWASENGIPREAPSGVFNSVKSLTWSPDAAQLAAAGFGAIRIWDLENMENVRNVIVGFSTSCVGYSRDGSLIIGADKSVIVLMPSRR
jgi:WD40 repeat protein